MYRTFLSTLFRIIWKRYVYSKHLIFIIRVFLLLFVFAKIYVLYTLLYTSKRATRIFQLYNYPIPQNKQKENLDPCY